MQNTLPYYFEKETINGKHTLECYTKWLEKENIHLQHYSVILEWDLFIRSYYIIKNITSSK